MKTTIKKALTGLLLIAGLIYLLDRGCVFYHLTGVPCPGCGMTRAHLAAMQLDFQTAFLMHPLWPVTVPLLGWAYWKKGRFFVSRRNNAVFIGMLVVVYLGVYLVRLCLLFPDTPPMRFDTGALLPSVYQWLRKII